MEYNPRGKEGETYRWLTKRIRQLQLHRQNIGGIDLNKVWKQADEEYIPHQYKDEKLKDWQSKQAGGRVFEKVNVALSVIVDQNPEAVLIASNPIWQKKNEFMKGLFDYTWTYKNNGPLALQLFTFNLAKYGWAIGRTYHRFEEREVSELTEYDPATGKNEYETKIIRDWNDPWTEILNPYDCWIDDMAKPDVRPRDWCWRKVYSMDDFYDKFPKSRFKNIDKVQPGGNTQESGAKESNSTKTSDKLIEVIFYESEPKDCLHILAGGISGILITPNKSPLPYMHKRLSMFDAYWTLRNTNTRYGIGVPEIMRGDNKLLDQLNNMSIDQLILSIYKMFFYSPANDFSEDQYIIEPGKGIPTNDPGAIQYLQIPGPGAEVPAWMERFEKNIDDITGVTKTIGGEALGKTAFEARQNLEAGLRRLKFPLRNIEAAFEIEGNLRLDLIQQIYSVPRAIRILGEDEWLAFEEDRKKNPQLYFEEVEVNPDTEEDVLDENGMPVVKERGKIEFKAVSLPFQRGEGGNMEHSIEDETFEITPEMIRWEGEIQIKPMSTLLKSPELEAQKALQIYNLLSQNPDIDNNKAIRRVLIKNQENPKEWLLSDEAIAERAKQAEEAMAAGAMQQGGAAEAGSAPKITEDRNMAFKAPTAGVMAQLFK